MDQKKSKTSVTTSQTCSNKYRKQGVSAFIIRYTSTKQTRFRLHLVTETRHVLMNKLWFVGYKV